MLPRYLRLHRRRCRYHSPVASFVVVVRLLAAFPIATSAARVTPIRLRCGLLLRSASATASSVAAAAAIPPASSVASPSLSSYDETKMKGELVCKKMKDDRHRLFRHRLFTRHCRAIIFFAAALLASLAPASGNLLCPSPPRQSLLSRPPQHRPRRL